MNEWTQYLQNKRLESRSRRELRRTEILNALDRTKASLSYTLIRMGLSIEYES